MLNNQRGSATAMALAIMIFATIVLSGVVPMVTTQLGLTRNNQNVIEAQLVAEAGAKRAIVAIANGRTDWDWVANNTHNALSNNDNNRFYIVTITPQIRTGDTPTENTPYTIRSEGHSGNSVKVTTTTVRTGSRSQTQSVYSQYAAFSNGKMYFNGGQVKILGDIASNSSIDLSWTAIGSITGYAYAPKDKVNAGNGVKQVTLGEQKLIENNDKLDIPTLSSLMIANPTVYLKTGTELTKTWTSGQWSGQVYQLTEPFCYYDGNYNLNGHSYAIPEGNSVTIYVNGKFNFMSGYSITGGGNLTIHAVGGFDFSGGRLDVGNGNVKLYTSDSFKLGNTASYIKAKSVEIYAKNDIAISGGYIDTGSNGTVKLYTTNNFTLNYGNYINGNEVYIVAENSATLNGGSINQSLSGAVTKIYTKDYKMDNNSSVISGNGAGLVMATNNITLSGGKAGTTLMVAGNNIDATNIGATVAGLYSNGTINISGVTITHSPTIDPSLDLPGGSSGTGTDFAVLSWSN